LENFKKIQTQIKKEQFVANPLFLKKKSPKFGYMKLQYVAPQKNDA